MSDNDDEQRDDKKDLTRLEDLSEFLHTDDPDVEEALKHASDSAHENESVSDFLDDSQDNFLDNSLDNSKEEASKVTDLTDLENGPEDDTLSSLFPSEDQNENAESPESAAWEETTNFQVQETDDDDNDDENLGFNSNDKTRSSFAISDFEVSPFNDTNTDDFNNTKEDLFSSDIDTLPDPDPDPESIENINNNSSFDNPLHESEFGDFEDSKNNLNELFDTEEMPLEEVDDYVQPILQPETQTQSTAAATPREDFQDLRDFGNAISYGMVKAGGNPPYTLILRNVKFQEDAEDIMILLREHGVVTEENENLTEQGLYNGNLLISQISEYSAIYLAHRMRRFDVQIRIGLSEQLHPSKSYSQENKGLISKYNLRQDRRESVEMQKNMVDIDDIIISTTSGLEGYDVLQYIKVLSAHHLISELELRLLHEKSQKKDHDSEEYIPQYAYQSFHPIDDQENNHPQEDEDRPIQQYGLGLEDIYSELAEELRNQAFKNEANAILGLSYSISPVIMPSIGNEQGEMHYKVTCTGNAVWISDRP